MFSIKRILVRTSVFLSLLAMMGLLSSPSLLKVEEAHAIRSIPDGEATRANGYQPHKDARKVYKLLKEAWDNGRNAVNPTTRSEITDKRDLVFVRGGKDPEVFSMWRGEQLVYDIYSGITNQEKKKAWRVIKSGGEHFFTFDGWAINYGHHHHSKENQATYIGAVNRDNPREKHIFKTRMLGNTSANPDMDHKGLKTCPNGAYNRRADPAYESSCNMRYNYTQFRAYIPIKDLFGGRNEGKVWELFIIKRVEDQVVYDELILPYKTETYDWKEHGKITMSSGRNTNTLRMLHSEVIKQKKPRGGSSGVGDLGYFVPGKIYRSTSVNESKGVANWFEVIDDQKGFGPFKPPTYQATNEKRWTSSAFWEFHGDVARLSLDITHATVKIQHIDETNKKLLDEESRQVKLGNTLTVSPKTKGYFKDKDGNEYIAVPHRNKQKFSEKITKDRTIKFYYKAIKEDPSYDEELKEGTEGRAEGVFSWELFKDNPDEESKIKVINNVVINGTHYATRNIKYKTSSNLFNETGNEPHEIIVGSLNKIKDQNINYTFEYEYTNHYRDIYKCVDGVTKEDGYTKDYCFDWEFDERVPSWKPEHTKKAKWEETIVVDHEHGSTYKVNEKDKLVLPFNIGRDRVFNDLENVDKKRVFREYIVPNPQNTHLTTQTYKDILETLGYQSDFDNELYVIDGDKYYFPDDLDESIRDEYQNNTDYDYSEYAIPLRLKTINNNQAEFVTKDNFFITEKTGFLFSLPYHETTKQRIEIFAREEFENFTGEKYYDNVLTSPEEGSRYYLNIDLNSHQEPETWYDDNVVIGKLGLSDVTIHLLQKIKFDHYLFGSPIDDPMIAEQHGSIVDDVEYTHSVKLTPEQIKELKEVAKDRGNKLHSFKLLDIENVLEKIREIIPSFPH